MYFNVSPEEQTEEPLREPFCLRERAARDARDVQVLCVDEEAAWLCD